MIVLGIDPGSLATGYGVVRRCGPSIVRLDGGVVAMPQSLPLPERLLKVHSAVAALIERHGPAAVSVESVFYAKNFKSAMTLAHVRGVVLLAAAEAGVPVHEYPPSVIKSAVTGSGAAAKEQVERMVRMLLKSGSEARHDAADALAAAICHINRSSGPLAEAANAAGRGRPFIGDP